MLDILSNINKVSSVLNVTWYSRCELSEVFIYKAKIFPVTDPILFTIGLPGLLGLCILGRR